MLQGALVAWKECLSESERAKRVSRLLVKEKRQIFQATQAATNSEAGELSMEYSGWKRGTRETSSFPQIEQAYPTKTVSSKSTPSVRTGTEVWMWDSVNITAL